MNVTCPNCAAIYRVDPAKVPAGGVRARCSVCSAVFAVRREGEAEVVQPLAPKPAPEPPRPAPEPPRPAPGPPRPAPEPPRPEPPRAVPPRPAAPAASPPSPAPAPPAPRPAAPVRPVAPAVPTAARPAPAAPPMAAPAAPAAPARAPAVPAQPSAPAAPAAPRPAAPAAASASRPAPSAPAGGRPANPFLSQDPSLKARRLARALISDMVVYHPGKRQEGLRDGNLKQLFEEEIKKSWEEYAEQVGREVAESTPYFREALNEILAGGRQIF